MKDEKISVMLPRDLCLAAMEEFGSEFGDLEQTLIFILTQMTRPDVKRLDQQEEQMIQDRLRDLGYV